MKKHLILQKHLEIGCFLNLFQIKKRKLEEIIIWLKNLLVFFNQIREKESIILTKKLEREMKIS